jgi:rSAM/selenodomain-associated transferase 2
VAHSADVPWLSVIVPALNEARSIADTLSPLQGWRSRGVEVLLVDGGSTDGTVEHASSLVDQVLHSRKGRALQMNAGAAAARGRLLWFLHADTRAPEGAVAALQRLSGPLWGRFPVRLAGAHPMFPVIARAMNARTRSTRIATGDQGIFVQRQLFRRLGGFPEQPLMEDIALTERLRKEAGWPVCPAVYLQTDSRRWQAQGVWRTIVLMWRLRLMYWLGAAPETLHARYYGKSAND